MAYDKDFAHRIRELLGEELDVTEKAMVGGRAFALGGNMAVGISNVDEFDDPRRPRRDRRRARPAAHAAFAMTGRPMNGWILVAPEGVGTKRQLAPWVTRRVAFARKLSRKV